MFPSAARCIASRPVLRRFKSVSKAPIAGLEWDKLGFGYTPTRCHIRYVWEDGKWDNGTLVNDPYEKMHVLSGALHYGQALFEGLKAFRGVDDEIRVFNSDANQQRMKTGTDRFLIPEIPKEMFTEAVDAVVAANADYVPPVESGGSLYIRPNVFGTGPKLGLGPAPTYTFNVVVSPVGPYYKGGLEPVNGFVVEGFDRAAPHGVGAIKCGGNYAADLLPSSKAKGAGYPIALYLDAATRSFVEEFSTSNFIGITKDGKYVTPASASILPSTTNKVLQALASDQGMAVEEREVSWDEVGSFSEVGACGTAVVVTPLASIKRGDTTHMYSGYDTLARLYTQVQDIQKGAAEDKFGYCRKIEV